MNNMKALKWHIDLLVALIFLAGGYAWEHYLLKNHPETRLIEEFQQELLNNEKQLKIGLNEIKQSLAADWEEEQEKFFNRDEYLIEKSGFAYLVYENDKLQFWTDRSVAFFDSPDGFKKTSGLLRLPNGYFLIDTVQVDGFKVFGLHLIKHSYSFENKYLENDFFHQYRIPKDYIIDENYNPKAYCIRNGDGEFLFSIWPYGKYLCTTNQLYFPAAIYFLGLVFLLFFFRRRFKQTSAPLLIKVLGLAVALFVVYWFHLLFRVPKVFFHLRLFGPDYFAINYWLPSLGDYFLFALFFLFWLYNFGIEFRLSSFSKDLGLSNRSVFLALLAFVGFLFLCVHYFIVELVANSTISFALHEIVDISFHSVLGIFSVGLFLLGVIFFTIRLCQEAREEFQVGKLLAFVLIPLLVLALLQWLFAGVVYVEAFLLFALSVILSVLLSKNYFQSFTLSYLIIFISVVSVYSLVVINRTISEKEREHQKLLAVTLMSERDPAAEVFLAEIQQQIDNDPAIPSLLLQGEEVEEYIRRSYFNSYFRKYLLNIYVCGPSDSLLTEPDEVLVPCIPFMDELIENQGINIPGTHFYFMNNMNGRISYTGRLRYPLNEKGQAVTIYIDLDSDLLLEGIGFPELLIDKSLARAEIFRKFSYAKYYAGELTDKFGDFDYNYNGHQYLVSDNEFSFIRRGRFEHLVYHTQENNFVVVTRRMLTPVEYLIAFPYLFVFYFLMLMLILFLENPSIKRRKFTIDLKFKIQAAIISIVFISLLVVAVVTIMYNVGEYRSRHRNDLSEKMKSIAEEIDNRLTDKEEITPELVEWLQEELAKLSNIFRTDVNIYGTDGRLLASSREEIFKRGLVSHRMNARAYYEVYRNFKIEYMQPENIGQLYYMSAYRPIINYKGDYLGFINLPYFIKQDDYSQEITTYIVAFINLYVLLFLASIIVAVFIANQITRPLVLIQQNLRKMQLGKRNEPILYDRSDEIGSLVKEYNKKVEELGHSAELLARSERESAWREMAKQIAHEIKNPLTPMKLNIQHLQRYKAKDPEFDALLQRVTATLIEQIDNLSNIATEFSNFAKIPTAHCKVFELAGQLKRIIDLYEAHDKAKITFDANGLDTVRVNADPEQLSRAIINLIRNGIQSIPEGREGHIHVALQQNGDKVLIAVRDNGTGIPPELQPKLFSPSFTTKTSGMGLGLAISKNIVENFSGKIWFETEAGKGTTFFIEMPLYHEKEESN